MFNRKRLRPFLSLATLTVAVAFLPVQAGTPVSPGAIQDSIQQRPPALPLPQPVPEPETTDPSLPAAPAGPTVRVDTFSFVGNTVFSDADLAALLANYTGQQLSLTQIYAAADGITQLYRDAGYGLASAVIPAQRLNSGTVRIEIIEGRIGGVSIAGNERYSFGFLAKRFASLQPGDLYRNKRMETAVLLLNDLPGLEARAVIKPGTEYGTSNIAFRVAEDRFEGTASLDNYGREELGQIRLTANAFINNPGGFGDRLNGTVLASEDGLLTYGNIAYGFPVTNNGGRLRFTYNRADYEVEGDVFAALGIEGDNTTTRVDYIQPISRTRTRNVVFNAAVYSFETESFIADALLPNNATELTLLELGIFTSGLTTSRIGWTFSALVSGNGKANESTVTDIQSDAQQAKLRLDGSLSLPFGSNWLFYSRATVVHSSDPLVDSQKFSLGGPFSVRGYFPSELRGDQGAYLGLELRRYFRAGKFPIAATVFVDGGTAKRELLPGEDPSTDVEGELGSAGAGLIFGGETDRFTGSVVYAAPIDNHTSLNEDDDGHVWANVMVRF
ncbi:MAG: ShlB/FhaC/HecB family hemolysin secretion/activation protein [Gammaproteobacteria bacterium]|nr:ShlB/FhaC/HecB family hemolysin secretion/activation protein [Gammaproteobacteria bacterium]